MKGKLYTYKHYAKRVLPSKIEAVKGDEKFHGDY